MALDSSVLAIDSAAETQRICDWLAQTVGPQMRRRGLVIALSGGVDSSVCGALAVRALGPKKVFGLMMPEEDSSSTARQRGTLLAEGWGIAHAVEDIAPTLRAIIENDGSKEEPSEA